MPGSSKVHYYLEDQNSFGGKFVQAHLIGIAADNAFGERLFMFVIGKSQNPTCFKGIKHLHCRYRSLFKSWMFSELFEKWARELDRSLVLKREKLH